MTATITIIKRPPSQNYLPCRCGWISWGLVIEKDEDDEDCIKEIVCSNPNCGAVFRFGDEGIDVEFME
jgi:hypothetical protein